MCSKIGWGVRVGGIGVGVLLACGSWVSSGVQAQDLSFPAGVVSEEAEPGEPASTGWGHLLSRQLERVAQRAAADSTVRDLETWLGPDGLPSAWGSPEVRDALLAIADRCGRLLRGVQDPPARRVLYECQARVYNALAQDAAAHGDLAAAARHLGRLRTASDGLDGIGSPAARVAAGYWRLSADLIDANRTLDDPASLRRITRELLGRYLAGYAGVRADALATAYLDDARVSLARLLDEAGRQQAAVQALGDLAGARPGDLRYEQVAAVVARHAKIGSQVDLSLPGLDGRIWHSADLAGQPVLLHVFAQGAERSAGSISVLSEAIAAGGRGGFAVVSLHVGPLDLAGALPPWPVLVVEAEARGALASLGVDAVPVYLWVDEKGRLASIGRTPEAVDGMFPLSASGSGVGGRDRPAVPDTGFPDAGPSMLSPHPALPGGAGLR